MAYQYPVTEGLQHISHDPTAGLYHDDREQYETDGVKAYDKQTPYSLEAPEYYVPFEAQPAAKKICGLSRKKFAVVLVAVLLIIAGAVGGGVGGSLAADHEKKAVE